MMSSDFHVKSCSEFYSLEQVVCQNPKRFVVKAALQSERGGTVPASLWACCKELLCFYGFVCFGSKCRNQTGASSCHYTGAWVSFLFSFSQPFQLCNKIVLKCILVLSTLFLQKLHFGFSLKLFNFPSTQWELSTGGVYSPAARFTKAGHKVNSGHAASGHIKVMKTKSDQRSPLCKYCYS